MKLPRVEIKDCVFCNLFDHDNFSCVYDFMFDKDYDTVHVFEPLNPVTPGHVLVVPQKHATDASDFSYLTGYVFAAAARYAAMQEKDFNLITSGGTFATQTVPHLHVHYIPRYENDGLLLPWSTQHVT